MIITKAVDIEIFPNLFSVTFVDMQSYFNVFRDCVDSKGNPIPLTEKLTVAEIKRRLDTVKADMFYISDTDDSQLLSLVAYFNDMQAHYKTFTDDDGHIQQIPVRTDLFGFNNKGYDDIVIQAFLMYFNRFDSAKDLIKRLKLISDKVIALQDDKDAFFNDKELELIRSYKLPYVTVDVQQIYGLHSAGVNVDSKTGERVKFGKSLKSTSINLKWHEILVYTMHPADREEYDAYWHKRLSLSWEEFVNYRDSISEFNRYVLPQYVQPMLHYNKNDVFLVCEMVRQKPDEVRLRYSITKAFKINVLCSARANVADKLTVKFYSDMTGFHSSRFIKERTERTKLSFKKIIFPHIKFKTKQLQDLLTEMKDVVIYRTNKDSFSKTIEFYGTTYTLATGGIHSVDPPRVCVSDDEFTYIHWDYTSYYPSIMIAYKVCPKHLNPKGFIKMLSYLKDTRVKCKHGGDEDVIPGVPNKVAAEALKIVINSIYGKLGSEIFFLYDRFAQMQVTINGQLMTMSLIESLELEGIHVISANTDGIVVKLPNNKRDVFKDITDRWNAENKMSADGEEYERIVSRDVNNYFDIQKDGSVEYKGALDPKQYIKELKKGYDMPIVAKAVYEYFVNNTPVMETLRNHKDILDFCKTQNVGKKFKMCYDTVEDGKIVTHYTQKWCRFYVSTKGVVIQKEEDFTHKRWRLASGLPVTILNSLDDAPIEERNINYKYYYEECYKIIDPIRLGISPQQKASNTKGTVSGKLSIRKYSRDYLSLFDNE